MLQQQEHCSLVGKSQELCSKLAYMKQEIEDELQKVFGAKHRRDEN